VKKHCSEDDLILHYYGEGTRRADVDQHLAGCDACASMYREIAGTLAAVTVSDVPERGEHYGLEVWQRIRHQLPERRGLGAWPAFALQALRRGLAAARGDVDASGGGSWGLGWFTWHRFATAGAAAALLVIAFVAGRLWAPGPAPSAPDGTPAVATAGADDATRGRILLASVADHLERSERVLTDIMNAPEHGDISIQQTWAEDLLQTSRIYRQDAVDAGEQSVAMVLDELERNLLEIVHSPSQISAADLEQMRRRIDAAALLFKVRVMSDELRQREVPAPPDSPQPSTSKIS
jgi:hypothetical protein